MTGLHENETLELVLSQPGIHLKKQIVVAWSSAEVENRVLAHINSELTWLQHFIQKINLSPPISILMFCDN